MLCSKMSVCPVLSLITVKQYWHCKMINRYVYPAASNAHSLFCVLHRTSIKVRCHWLCSRTQILNHVAEYKVIKILETVKVSMQWRKINSKSNVQWITSHPCYIMWPHWSFSSEQAVSDLCTALLSMALLHSQQYCSKHSTQTKYYCLLGTVQSLLLLLKHHGLIMENKNF